ncbi:MAG: hypothetical protein M3Q44_03395 [bacterium]|nr:hypothetical protein [bacterium]
MRVRTIIGASALALVFAFMMQLSLSFAAPASRPIDEPPPRQPTVAQPTPINTPVQLPPINAPATQPTAQPAAPSCPNFTGSSSDFSTYYIACGTSTITYFGPGGEASGSIGEGSYAVSDRRCFSGSTELNCEAGSALKPNWFRIPSGWVTNGVTYSGPIPIPTISIPAAQSAASQSTILAFVQWQQSAPFAFTACYPDPITINLPGVAFLTGIDIAHFTWTATNQDNLLIQGPTTFIVRNNEPFLVSLIWAGTQGEESSGIYAQAKTVVTIEGNLTRVDGSQLSVAPVFTYTYQCEPPAVIMPAPVPTKTPRSTNNRDN